MRVNDYSHRAVVDKRHLHVGAKLPFTARLRQSLVETVYEITIERHRRFWTRRTDVGRAVSLACRRMERELADDKNLATNVDNLAVHLTRIIVEYAQTERFFHQPFHIVGSVVVLHADKYHHARTYGRLKNPANRDRRLANSLYNNSHNSANLRKILDYRLLAHFF